MSPPPGLLIRAFEPADAAGLTSLLNQPGVRFGTMRLPFESVEAVKARTARAAPENLHLIAELEAQLVASASLEVGRGRRRHVGWLGMSVHDQFTRRGIGTALLEALLDCADNWLDLKRLQLEVYEDNDAAIRLYERHGFEREGTLRAHGFRDGRYVDALVMARLKPSFPYQASAHVRAPSSARGRR